MTGTVFAAALNRRETLEALGEALSRDPYRSPPKAPVLHLKPANTWIGPGEPIPCPPDVPALRMGGTIGLVIGRTASSVTETEALSYLGGLVVVNAKNALDHDALWNANFKDLHEALSAISSQINSIVTNLEKDRPVGDFDSWFQAKTKPPILFLAQSVVCLPTPAGLKTVTPLKALFAYWPGGRHDEIGHGIASAMVEILQNAI